MVINAHISWWRKFRRRESPAGDVRPVEMVAGPGDGVPSDERAPVRERLLELFGLVGDADARVIRARGRLASLLF